MPQAHRFRQAVGDLFLDNEVSGLAARRLLESAVASGAQHVGDLARVGGGGRFTGNVARDLRRRLLRTSLWPKPYFARIPLYNPKHDREELASLALFLPHELLACIAKLNGPEKLQGRSALDRSTLRDLERAEGELGICNPVPIGIWCDGVPFNSPRSQTLECMTFLLPNMTGDMRLFRMPLVAFNKRFLLKGQTYDAIAAVLQWSFRAAALGLHPTRRHDGLPFGDDEKFRTKAGGTQLRVQGILVEIRGDWAMLKDVFRMPSWNSTDGICFLCSCTPRDIRSTSSSAAWRQERRDSFDLLRRLQERGDTVSPLLGAPGVRVSCFKLDWLHIADLGIGADAVANILLEVQDALGGTRAESLRTLWRHIRGYYNEHPEVDSRIDKLTQAMLQQPQKAPKLRAKAAEVRGLVRFAYLAADRFLGHSEHDETVRAAAKELWQCYDTLSGRSIFHADLLAEHSRKFCTLYVALEQSSRGRRWRVKPKLHMFQEMAEYTAAGQPSLFWTYRDEDFGGALARIAKRRGGYNSPKALSLNVLQHFAARYRVPRL